MMSIVSLEVTPLCRPMLRRLVVYKPELDAKSRGRTEAKQHMTPKIRTHSLTKSIRHQNTCPRRGVHTQERNYRLLVLQNQFDTETHVLVGVFIHRKEMFNILDFLHRINVRKRVKIISTFM